MTKEQVAKLKVGKKVHWTTNGDLGTVVKELDECGAIIVKWQQAGYTFRRGYNSWEPLGYGWPLDKK